MRVYGHLQVEHSLAMGKRVSFDAPSNVIPMPRPTEAKESPSAPAEAKRAVAKAKAKYGYPWWASENPLEVFWGQLNEETPIIPVERFLEVSKQAMGREVLQSELADREALADELSIRISANTLDEIRAKLTARNATGHEAVK
jgi:hypothetical protein